QQIQYLDCSVAKPDNPLYRKFPKFPGGYRPVLPLSLRTHSASRGLLSAAKQSPPVIASAAKQSQRWGATQSLDVFMARDCRVVALLAMTPSPCHCGPTALRGAC